MVCKTGDYCQIFYQEKTVRTRKKGIFKSKEICCTTNKPPFFFLLYLHYTVNTSFSLPYLTHVERMTKTYHPMFVNNSHISIAKVYILYSLHNIVVDVGQILLRVCQQETSGTWQHVCSDEEVYI